MRFYLFLSLIIFMAACSSKDWREQEFKDIEIGMSKSEVLGVAGPPHWSDRYKNVDRWIYYMKPERKQSERVVYFRNGTVFQKGLREKPTLSAEEMDHIKEPRLKTKPYKRKYTDEQLRAIIKKEIEKEGGKKKKPTKLEKI